MKYLFSIAFILFLGFSSQAQKTKDIYVSIDFLNKSASSIPLVIEGVMKPNLSPFSRSGVTCKAGTRVWTKGKKDLVFVVTQEMDGSEIVVNKVIAKMKRNKKGDQKSAL